MPSRRYEHFRRIAQSLCCARGPNWHTTTGLHNENACTSSNNIHPIGDDHSQLGGEHVWLAALGKVAIALALALVFVQACGWPSEIWLTAHTVGVTPADGLVTAEDLPDKGGEEGEDAIVVGLEDDCIVRDPVEVGDEVVGDCEAVDSSSAVDGVATFLMASQ